MTFYAEYIKIIKLTNIVEKRRTSPNKNKKVELTGYMYALFTDTDTDITPEVARKYDYHLISMPYTVGENEIYPYKDEGYRFDVHEFYQSLRDGVMPKTSGLSPQTYKDYFEPFFKDGKDILYVHFSAAMSGTFDAMRIALRELKEAYPERKFYEVDTKGITIGSYNIVLEIGDLYKQGKSPEEILEWAKTEVDKFAVYFFADDLRFFARSGRVKGFKAFMGNILGVRPIIYMGSDGMMTSIDTARGRNNAITRLVSYVERLQHNIKSYRVIIGHSDALDTAKLVGERLKTEFGEDLNIEYVAVNPTAGSHCGPNAVGVSFHAVHR